VKCQDFEYIIHNFIKYEKPGNRDLWMDKKDKQFDGTDIDFIIKILPNNLMMYLTGLTFQFNLISSHLWYA